nr:DUF2812 domain-containing protein [uncultured Blautia sp.]
MEEVKKEFRWFSITEYEKEAEYLSRRHKDGWKFKNVTMPGIYTFEKCEPQDVIYQLDYNPDGVKNQEEYVQMFEDCGWEYLKDFAGYTYFRKPAALMKKEENIFCDDQSRLDMLNRIFRGRIIPLLLIFVTLLVNGVLNMDNTAMTIVYGVLTGIYTLIFLQFAVKYISFRNRMIKN